MKEELETRWHDLGEFILPYDAVRREPSPERAIQAFVESTYARAAELEPGLS